MYLNLYRTLFHLLLLRPRRIELNMRVAEKTRNEMLQIQLPSATETLVTIVYANEKHLFEEK